MIATGPSRSDFIIGPVLRVGRAGFALVHMVVHAGHGLARGLGEPAADRGMNQARATRADELGPDLDGACSVARPAHAKRPWMLSKHSIHRARRFRLGDLLFASHALAFDKWRPRQDSNLWPSD